MMKRLVPLLVCAVLVALLVAQSAPANLIVNGDFASDLSGWTQLIATPGVTITWDSGSAKLSKPITTAASTDNYLYQIVPVTVGVGYQLDAKWKGDITTGTTIRQWAEVFVGFTNTNAWPVPPMTATNIMYKKGSYGGPNAPTGPWGWESILLSPNTSPVPPAGGIFTATNSYMVVAFNIGGRANGGPAYYNFDNVSVTPEPATMAILGLGGLFLRRRLA